LRQRQGHGQAHHTPANNENIHAPHVFA